MNEYDDWQCTVWAQSGECQRNSEFMNAYCKKACKLCGETDVNFSGMYTSCRCITCIG